MTRHLEIARPCGASPATIMRRIILASALREVLAGAAAMAPWAIVERAEKRIQCYAGAR